MNSNITFHLLHYHLHQIYLPIPIHDPKSNIVTLHFIHNINSVSGYHVLISVIFEEKTWSYSRILNGYPPILSWDPECQHLLPVLLFIEQPQHDFIPIVTSSFSTAKFYKNNGCVYIIPTVMLHSIDYPRNPFLSTMLL